MSQKLYPFDKNETDTSIRYVINVGTRTITNVSAIAGPFSAELIEPR